MRKKKKIITVLIVLLLIFSLIPIPRHYKDGGTIEYKAVLFQVFRWHSINIRENISSNTDYIYDGLEVKILGITIYNNAKVREVKYSDCIISDLEYLIYIIKISFCIKFQNIIILRGDIVD